MKKTFVVFVVLCSLFLGSVAAHAERGDIGGIGTTSLKAKPFEGGSIVPFERGCVGGVGCTTSF